MHSLFSTKPLDALLGDTERPEQRLKRTLGPVHLTFLGIGAIVGAGIFSLVGASAENQDLSALGDSVLRAARATQEAPHLGVLPIIFNLPAVLIVALITWILVRGIRESARFNSTMVLLKLAIVLFFVGVGAFHV